MNDSGLAARIKEAALECGFEVCGIIKTGEMKGYAEAIEKRVACYPESEFLYGPMVGFAEPEQSVPWAKSIIICARWHGKYRIPEHLKGLISKGFCVDSRKDPLSREYQGSRRFEAMLDAMGLRHASKSDFGITAMRWAAAKAGIGLVRKNNFFYVEKGSWCSLESYFIERELELKAVHAVKACPEQCGRCLRACPTGALGAPYQMNGPACVACLTGMLTCAPGAKHYDKCGSWIFGCDACQDACPFNKNAWSAEEEYPGLDELAAKISYERLLAMDYDTMRGFLPQKFWYISEDEVWKWKCNVLNAMHNTYEEQYRPHIERALKDSRAEVRDMAQWVLDARTSEAGA